MKKTVLKTVWQALIAVAALLLIWAVAYFLVGNDYMLPSVFDCFLSGCALLATPTFWQAFLGTILRVFFAFVLSFVFAAVFAVISYLLPPFGGVFSVIVAVMRSLPVLAVLLIILTFSSAGVAPVIVAFLSLFPMLYTAFHSALLGVDKNLIEMSRVYKVPLKKQLCCLYIPSVLPTAVETAGAAFAFSLKLVVSAEVLARTAQSLGAMIQDMQIYSQTAEVFALVAVTCVAAVCVETLGMVGAKALKTRGVGI